MPLPFAVVVVVLRRVIVFTRVLEKAQTKPQLPVHRAGSIRLGHASFQTLLFLKRFALLAPVRPVTCAGGLTGSEDRFVVSPPEEKCFLYYKRFYLDARVISGRLLIEVPSYENISTRDYISSSSSSDTSDILNRQFRSCYSVSS